ncbi:MAG: radical SAM protein [Desulfobulbaceae bacterium]|nr:radical SAM protein [Desulfobulbaceae bacterium]
MFSTINSISYAHQEQGRFTGGRHRPLMAMVEITNRCNMRCPICFTDAGGKGADVGMEEIKIRLHNLLDVAGPIPVQISGGEPTLYPQLPDIIGYAKQLGFNNIELVTNGIVVSQNTEYLVSLVGKGLTAVYLQFDGLSKETYRKIRGQDMSMVRMRCIAAIRKAKICCTLAVAVTRKINDHELGEIVRFGIKNIDTVRAINFQSAARFAGRFEVDTQGSGYRLSELTHLVEEQSGLAPGGIVSDVLGHSHCNAMSLVYVIDGRLEPLYTYISKSTRDKFLGPDRHQTILDLFQGKEKFYQKYFFDPKTWKALIEAVAIFGKRPSFQSIMNSKHILLFAKSFMESSALDVGRVNQCCYGIAGTKCIRFAHTIISIDSLGPVIRHEKKKTAAIHWLDALVCPPAADNRLYFHSAKTRWSERLRSRSSQFRL